MNKEIKNYLAELKALYPEISSIWLIGSRANGTARQDSDWDFLLFGNEQIFKDLTNDDYFHRNDVDLLVIVDSEGHFKKPRGQYKQGTLASWQWKQLTDDAASYRSVKFIPDSPGSAHGNIKEEILKAKRIDHLLNPLLNEAAR